MTFPQAGPFADMRSEIMRFINERDWERFHRPKDVSMALSIESSELLELYLWDREPEKERIEEEAADVLFFLVDLAAREDIDLEEAFRKKMERNRRKYPIEESRGRDDKYTSYIGKEGRNGPQG